MKGTGLFSKVNSTLWVALTDIGSGEAMLARCNGAAPTTAGLFAEGCLMIRIDNGKLYSNQGTAETPEWNSVSDVDTAEITDEAVTNAKLGAPKIGVIQATIGVADFTDNEDTTGTYEFTDLLPAGAVVQQTMISDVTGFAGDTSAVVTIGDGTDVDRYNTGTPNVFADADDISAGAVSGTAYDADEETPTVIVTTDSDFGLAVTNGSGEMTITIFYFVV